VVRSYNNLCSTVNVRRIGFFITNTSRTQKIFGIHSIEVYRLRDLDFHPEFRLLPHTITGTSITGLSNLAHAKSSLMKNFETLYWISKRDALVEREHWKHSEDYYLECSKHWPQINFSDLSVSDSVAEYKGKAPMLIWLFPSG